MSTGTTEHAWAEVPAIGLQELPSSCELLLLTYPEWIYFPTRSRPPSWVTDFVAVVEARREAIDSHASSGVRSDHVLTELRPGLELLGYRVEASKRRADTVRRPVLFGDQGAEVVTYEVDAVHDELGILVEIEAGRGAMSNAVYRDLVHASLIVDARHLVLGVMSEYRYSGGTAKSYRDARDLLHAIYGSGRLELPFEGVLLFGY